MNAFCTRCGPVDVAPGQQTCSQCGTPVLAAQVTARTPEASSRPPLAGPGAIPPRVAGGPPTSRPTGLYAVPPSHPQTPPLSTPRVPGSSSDAASRTIIYDQVLPTPQQRPATETPPIGTARYQNVIPVPQQQQQRPPLAPVPPPRKPSGRIPVPAPGLAAPQPAAPPPPAKRTTSGRLVPVHEVVDNFEEVGGRTMEFEAVIALPTPPDAPAAGPGETKKEEDEPGEGTGVLTKKRSGLVAYRRAEAEPEAGARALVLVLVVLLLGGVLFAAGYAVSQAAAQRKLDEAIGKAKNELDHGNAQNALLILNAVGATNQANAEAQMIRGRALLMIKKTNEAQSAIALGLRDRSASARDKGSLQAIAGEAGLQQGNAEQAVRDLKDSLDQDAKNARTHQLLGLAYSLVEQWADAKRELDEALRLDATVPRARLVRAQVSLRLGDKEEAEKDLDFATASGSDPDALLLRGDLRLRAGDAVGALDDAASAERLAAGGASVTSNTRPSDLAVWRRALVLRAHAKLVQNDAGLAEEALDELIRGGLDDDDELRFVRMRILAVAGRLDEGAKLAQSFKPAAGAAPAQGACEAAERALVLLAADRLADATNLLEGSPTPPSAAFHAVGRAGLAQAAIELARGSDRALSLAEGAAAAFDDKRALVGGAPILVIEGAAIPAGSLEPAAILIAGRAALRAGDETRAHAFFDKAVAAAPKSPRPLVARAIELLRRGETQRATADLDAALVLAPDDPEVLRRRAGIALAAQDAVRAAQLLDKAASAGGRDPYIYLDRCRAEEMRGQHQAALAALERARELGLPTILYIEGRSKISLGQGELEPAEHWLDRLLEKRPFDLDALEARARVRAARGNLVQAAQDYGALRSLAPRVDYDRALARIAIDRKEYPTAKSVLLGSLARAPKDAELHGLMGRLALREKRYPEAERELRTALSMNEKLYEPTIDLALVMLVQGEEGIEFFLRQAKSLSPEADNEGTFLRTCEEMAATSNPESWYRAGKGARALAEVTPHNRAAHAVVLKTTTARRDWQGLLEGSIRCLAAFPNDPEAGACKRNAIKNGAKEGVLGTGGDTNVPPPRQPEQATRNPK